MPPSPDIVRPEDPATRPLCYSVRTLLGVLTVAAFASAAVAPFYWSLNDDARGRLPVVLVFALAGVILYEVMRRNRAKREAQKLLLLIERKIGSSNGAKMVYAVVLFTALFSIGVVIMDGAPPMTIILSPLFWSAILWSLSRAMFVHSCYGYARFQEDGVAINDNNLHPWKQVRFAPKEADGEPAELTLRLGGKYLYEEAVLLVSPEQRQQIDEVIARYAGAEADRLGRELRKK